MDSITSGLATSTLRETKFKIQQSIPSGSVKKGPHTIVRSADLNDGIEIKRRFGEGSKPLFARDDITVNQTTTESRDGNSAHDRNFEYKSKSNRRSSSNESSSPERYRHRENKKHSSPTSSRHKSPGRSTYEERPNYSRGKYIHNSKFSRKTDRYTRRQKSKSRSPSPVKKKLAEKLPYYRDEQREKDRLRRLYGHSRSRSPPTSSGKKDSPIVKRRVESPSSRDRHHRHSPYRSSKRDYRSRRSRTRSRTRSPQRRERHKNSSKDSDKDREDSNTYSTSVISAAPPYIPIPVPVPADYAAYSFLGWPSQPPWHPPPHRPPSAPPFAPFPMWPMIPPMRPSHQAPYVGLPPALSYTPMTAQYRPHASQRYPPPRHNANSYQSRPKKPSS